MDPVRLPRQCALFQEGGFWILRWTEEAIGLPVTGHALSRNLTRIGAASGPDAVPESEALRLARRFLLSRRPPGTQANRALITIAEFVGTRFLPEFVAAKTLAGRAHYHSILKHVLSPEELGRIIAISPANGNGMIVPRVGWPYLGNLRLRDVRSHHVQQLLAAASASGYSPQTVRHIRSVVSALFSFAKQELVFMGTNPARSAKTPEIVRKSAPLLTLAQMEQIIRAMRYPEKEIALFALLADMNVAEICGLQWKYVNLSNESHILEEDSIPPRTIAVRKQSYRSEFGPVVGTRKRFIPIPELLHSILQQLKHRKTLTAPDDFVLASRTGTPIYPDNIAARRLKWIGTTLEIPWLSWHVFHRTRMKLMAEFGRHLNKELEKTLPLNPAAIPPPRGALKGEFRPKSKD